MAPITAYPKVVSEEWTLTKLCDGYSCARFGDGEGKFLAGSEYTREPRNAELTAAIRQVMTEPVPQCLICIPRLDKRSPKYANWWARREVFWPYLLDGVTYYSSFITRPDSAPWIETEAFAEQMVALWMGKKAVVVSEPDSKLLTVVKVFARKTEHIACPMYGASAHIQEYEQRILKSKPDVAVLSHGVSATVLAYRLARHGVQALDLGSVGAMLLRLLQIERVPHVYPYALSHPVHQGDIPACIAALEAAGFVVRYSDVDREARLSVPPEEPSV